MRQGFHDFLIAVHLKTHVDACMAGAHEYVVPLIKELEMKNVFSSEAEDRFPLIYGRCVSIRPTMASCVVRTEYVWF